MKSKSEVPRAVKPKEVICSERWGWDCFQVVGVGGGTVTPTGEMEKHPMKSKGHCLRPVLCIRENLPSFLCITPQRWWATGVEITGTWPMEVAGVRWYLLPWATYIISILARGARGATGTHRTLEETEIKEVRIARIRKKEGEGWDWKEEVRKTQDWGSFNRIMYL